MQADMELKKELRVRHLDPQAEGRPRTLGLASASEPQRPPSVTTSSNKDTLTPNKIVTSNPSQVVPHPDQ